MIRDGIKYSLHQPLTTRCRHEIYAQYASAVETYDKEDIQIVSLRCTELGQKYRRHVQLAIRIKGKWMYIDNRWRDYYFERTPRDGYEIIETFDNPRGLE